MKFYYQGQLLRTSKNHEYTHAVIWVGPDIWDEKDRCLRLIGCASTLAGAEKTLRDAQRNGIKGAKIVALERR